MLKYLLVLIFIYCSFQSISQKKKLKPTIGIAENIANDSTITAAGYNCIVENLGKWISPKTVSDEQFTKNIELFKKLKTPIYAFNIFLPGDLKVVGPKVDEKAILDYVEIVMQRLSQTDTKMIIWGSGGSRNLPKGFDKEMATKQFIYIAKKIAQIALKYKIIVCLEALNTTECNFINSVKDALYVVKKVNNPNLRLNVDIYHMMKDNEGPDIIAKTKKYVMHVEIAEREGRTAPGVVGTDFKPYLKELAKVKFHEKIVIEGRWKNVVDIAKMSKDFLQKQVDEVWGF